MNDARLIGEGVEIGVRDGEFSDITLSLWKGSKLHLVDPWLEQDSKIYNDISNVAQKEQNDRFELVSKTMKSKYPGRHRIHRNLSTEAVKNFQDRSLDYVYIDARHDYDGVKEDLEAWWPKLRDGGIFAGHDFVPDGTIKAGVFGVQGAVFDFATKVGREIQSIATKNKDGGRAEPQWVDGGWSTWYTVK
eukprot:CAMPEP_0172155688 /NCGR_PEP_ID=MMETSP1050-20130122/2769_1 /TAXON_ID=233186 /ORGANISM="Cryptomonas curvata, Strain CCAP979/52" /LENGTH=189 /DNA_ID=CAMNT_0012824623 /DNA_START=176 /DNA_END=742 /DNA_ORIENTATION=+